MKKLIVLVLVAGAIYSCITGTESQDSDAPIAALVPTRSTLDVPLIAETPQDTAQPTWLLVKDKRDWQEPEATYSVTVPFDVHSNATEAAQDVEAALNADEIAGVVETLERTMREVVAIEYGDPTIAERTVRVTIPSDEIIAVFNAKTVSEGDRSLRFGDRCVIERGGHALGVRVPGVDLVVFLYQASASSESTHACFNGIASVVSSACLDRWQKGYACLPADKHAAMLLSECPTGSCP